MIDVRHGGDVYIPEDGRLVKRFMVYIRRGAEGQVGGRWYDARRQSARASIVVLRVVVRGVCFDAVAVRIGR